MLFMQSQREKFGTINTYPVGLPDVKEHKQLKRRAERRTEEEAKRKSNITSKLSLIIYQQCSMTYQQVIAVKRAA